LARGGHAERHVDVNVLDAREGEDGVASGVVQRPSHRTCGRCEHDVESHMIAVDLHVLDEAEGDDVSMKVRILDDLQGLENLVTRYCHSAIPFANRESPKSYVTRSPPRGRGDAVLGARCPRSSHRSSCEAPGAARAARSARGGSSRPMVSRAPAKAPDRG